MCECEDCPEQAQCEERIKYNKPCNCGCACHDE